MIKWADSDFPSRPWTLRMDPQVTLSGKLQPIQVGMSLMFQTSRIYFKIRNHSPDDKMINRSLLFLDTPRKKKHKKTDWLEVTFIYQVLAFFPVPSMQIGDCELNWASSVIKK